jgi:hypothetical protein
MFFPALAVLLDRAALELLGGNRSDEQRGHGGGGDGDGELTHDVFSLGLSLAVPGWIFHIICLCEIYIHGNIIYAEPPRMRSIIVNETAQRIGNTRYFNEIYCYPAVACGMVSVARAVNSDRAKPLKQHIRVP